MAKWYDFVSTGFGPIDAEHGDLTQQVHRVLGAINSGDDQEARRLATVLVESVALHFAHEERLMLAHAYPEYARHKEAHDGFVAEAHAHLRGIAGGEVTAPFRRWATGRLLAWFRFHILASDVDLGRFLAAAGDAV